MTPLQTIFTVIGIFYLIGFVFGFYKAWVFCYAHTMHSKKRGVPMYIVCTLAGIFWPLTIRYP